MVSSSRDQRVDIVRPRQSNLHCIEALSTAAFIDVIGPPYKDDVRPCTYYRHVPEPPGSGSVSSALSSSSTSTVVDGSDPAVVSRQQHHHHSPPTIPTATQNHHLHLHHSTNGTLPHPTNGAHPHHHSNGAFSNGGDLSATTPPHHNHNDNHNPSDSADFNSNPFSNPFGSSSEICWFLPDNPEFECDHLPYGGPAVDEQLIKDLLHR